MHLLVKRHKVGERNENGKVNKKLVRPNVMNLKFQVVPNKLENNSGDLSQCSVLKTRSLWPHDESSVQGDKERLNRIQGQN